ncbi:hypothetical protein FBU30_009552 [Linnemannia zychae]|nr:hypothetical protein FBU30_009552 [Linnemannia zychae]
MHWYKRHLPCDTGIARATTHLENALKTRNTSKDRPKALKLCDKAQESLERINTSIVSPLDLDRIIAKYRELGAALEKLEFPVKAKLSYDKASELSAAVGNIVTCPPLHPLGSDSTSMTNATVSTLDSPSTLTTVESLNIASPSDNNIIVPKNNGISFASIFTKDYEPPFKLYELPKQDERLVNTQQLAVCLALLQAPTLSEGDTLTLTARNWLADIEEYPDEQERLKLIAKDLIRAYFRDEIKNSKVTAEVVCLASVLEKEDYQSLLSQLVNRINDALILEPWTLEGLEQLLQGASSDYLAADDLVRILSLLSERLKNTFHQSSQHIYRLVLTVSRVLDAMVDTEVKGLDREKLHEPLLSYLDGLKSNSDPHMVFHAAYTYQALLYVPDNEEAWQTALRRSQAVLKGIAGLVSAVKGLNVNEFIEGLSHIQDGIKGISVVYEAVQNAYSQVVELMESGESLRDALIVGLSFGHKRDWYPLLRSLDVSLRGGKLTTFMDLIYKAPCRRDPAFQWGICQRLGGLAANSLWDIDARQRAIAFLGMIYQNDIEWGKEPHTKQCIIDILLRLSSISDIGEEVKTLLKKLENDGDEGKQALYQVCMKSEPSPHPLNDSVPLLESSFLLDQVQNKPYVEPALRKLRLQRLKTYQELKQLYIPPQATATRDPLDSDFFDLTTRVNEFLSSDHKVLLLLGDSGAGKSTFNRELEHDLWEIYKKDKNRIPLFLTLAAIDKPEDNLIENYLEHHGFNKAQIEELKTYHSFILICDGYDEYQKKDNIYISNQFNQSGEWKVKMIISCRSEYLGSDYRLLFEPGDRNSLSDGALLQEAVIAPFSRDKIKDYIQQYVQKYKDEIDPRWSSEVYWHVMESIPTLHELVKNPFLLTLALKVLPRVVDRKQDLSLAMISRVTLYDNFLDHWAERGCMRLFEKKSSAKEKEAFDELFEEGFIKRAICFVKDLAVAIFEHQNGNPLVIYPSNDKETWKAEFFSQDIHKRLLREASPLVRQGNQYRFIHRSVLEYGLARAAYEPQSNKIGDQDDQGTGQTSTSPLYRKHFIHEPSILQFLAERVQQQPKFKQELLDFIEQSKSSEDWSIAAANAITILVKAGIRFNRADLKKVKIRYADLSNGQFDSAQLEGADLRDTKLSSIWMRQANLSQAHMAEVKFGEWPYLMVDNAVVSCVYSPDGKVCAMGHQNGAINIHDTSTWGKIQSMDGHRGAVTKIAFSLDGQEIASGGRDWKVRLWNVETGTSGLILDGHISDVTCLVYSPNGHQIASTSMDKTVRLWDVKTGAPGHVLRGHTFPVICVGYSPCGRRIASGSWDSTVRLWDSETGTPGLILRGHGYGVTSVIYSPSGQQIATGSDDRTVRLWDAETGAPGPVLNSHSAPVVSVVYSPEGHQIASGSHDMTVRLWDAQTGAPGPLLSGHTGKVTCVAYSRNGDQIASGSEDNTVRLWDVHSDSSNIILNSHTGGVSGVAYSPCRTKIASSSYDRTIRVWDAQTGAPSLCLSGHTGVVTSVDYSPSGQQIASGGYDKKVRLWDAQSGEPGLILSGHIEGILCVVYSPNGSQIASGGLDNNIHLWDAQTGALGCILLGHTKEITCVVYSPCGQKVASGSWDKTVRLWDTQTSASGLILNNLAGRVTSLAYSPCGQQIALGSSDETVRLWDAKTGAPGSILNGHSHDISSLMYSPCGQMIASGCQDMTVRLWDVSSAQCLTVVKGLNGDVTGISWNVTPDRTYFATGCSDKSVCVWHLVLDEGNYRVHLHWSTISDRLTVSDASIRGVQGLSVINTRLLQQRGAVDEPVPPLSCDSIS